MSQECIKSKVKMDLFWLVGLIVLSAISFFEIGNYLYSIWLLLFVWIAHEDLQEASFPFYAGVAFIVNSMVIALTVGTSSHMAVEVACGLLLAAVSWGLRKQFGLGDALVMMGVLLALGAKTCVNGFIIAALCGVIQTLAKKVLCVKDGNLNRGEIVFTPLLLIGICVYRLIE